MTSGLCSDRCYRGLGSEPIGAGDRGATHVMC
jgi:hypothetical protein